MAAIRNEELELAREQLGRVERALESLRRDVLPRSRQRFELMAEGYMNQMKELRAQIDGYLIGRSETIQHGQ